MKTYMAKIADVKRKWLLVDAKDKVLGRVATRVASILRGKTKPTYTPHVDVGDHVVVVNAGKVRITGRKLTQKVYKRFTGYPGGLREVGMETMMERKPAEALRISIKGMLPKNKLGRQMFKKLKIYAEEKHDHAAQNPQLIDLK